MKEWFVDLHTKKDKDGNITQLTGDELKAKRDALTDKLFKEQIVKDKEEAMLTDQKD